MVDSIASNAQMVYGFQPKPSVPEQILEHKDKFDDSPKNGTQELQARNEERREVRQESNRPSAQENYTASAVTSESSLRGGSLDISV